MDPIITFEQADITTLMAYVGTLWADFNILILFAIGLPLAFYVIRKVVALAKIR